MPFSDIEKSALLTVKGVGNTVIQRLEQMGIDSLSILSTANAEDITKQAAAMLNATCWKNSPQAKAAINNAIQFAKAYCQSNNLK
ncbi:helix-hairpin-helix domain-containing protein [Entomomonas asaccharolytica]|uniref:Helix-hairpin-helix domain-containing protein n=1 Tax=Entomomonas asaccharolytica TaxID=2785331 RepID=A0A974NGR1_9GAMM|nr:helix-hairpin-helix domain-containing protein [Entomomonas asaccharolytica]QQP86353.1 helix-hairpin-helix domain-containing protein [Entomomonas asaccharolytica]